MATAQQLNVLVVDRNEGTRVALEDFLEKEGYRPTSISDPSNLVDEVKAGSYQIVLLDLGAPEVDGVMLLQRIRSVNDDLCVICMTDDPTVETARATLRSRAFDYLEKPLQPERLRPVIQEAIKEHGLLVDVENQLNAAVGRRARERRTELGLTLKQVAHRTGLSVSLISQIELGKSAASVLTLHKLATALGVRMGHFFETV